MNTLARNDPQPQPGAAREAAGATRLSAWMPALLLAIPLVVVLVFGVLTTPAGRLLPQAEQAPLAGGGAGAGTETASPTTQRGPSAQSGSAAAPPDIEKMVERLAERLKEQPDDARGWSTLAHSYYVLKRFPDAVLAYEKLLAIAPPSADTLADYADALAMAQGRSLTGKPMELVRQAIELNPEHWKALSMAGTDAYQRKDYASAAEFWQRARASVPADSENARVLDANVAEARQLAGQQR